MSNKEKFLYENDYQRIGDALLNGYRRTRKSAAVSIFLCGGKMDDIRFARTRFFKAVESEQNITMRTPEGLFDDLLEKRAYDLLELEEVLAESVDAIVIFPESPGSFAELGAFSSNGLLRKKLICVCDKTYKGSLSFINVGPIKLLKKVKRSHVVDVKYAQLDDPGACKVLGGKIATLVREIRKGKSRAENGLFFLEDLITGALFCLHSATRAELKKLYRPSDVGIRSDKFDRILDICLSTLLTANKVVKDEEDCYALSKSFVTQTLNQSNKERRDMLTQIMVDAMNASLRRQAESNSTRMLALLP